MLANGTRVYVQYLDPSRLGKCDKTDRGVVVHSFRRARGLVKPRVKRGLVVVWDSGEVDDLTDTSYCRDHPWRVLPIGREMMQRTDKARIAKVLVLEYNHLYTTALSRGAIPWNA